MRTFGPSCYSGQVVESHMSMAVYLKDTHRRGKNVRTRRGAVGSWQFPSARCPEQTPALAAWKADLTELNTIKVGGREVRVPRRLAKAYKNGLLDVED